MQISIESDLIALQRDMNKAGRDFIDRAASQAINKTIARVRTVARKAIGDQANLPKRYINKHVTITKKSNVKSMYAEINTSTGRATNLIEYVSGDLGRFRRRKKKKSRNNFTKTASKGVTARPYERSQSFKGGFIVKGKNSGKLVAVKRSRNNKLKSIHGPSLRGLFIQDKAKKLMKSKVDREFPIELNRALNFNLMKKARKTVKA